MSVKQEYLAGCSLDRELFERVISDKKYVVLIDLC